MASSALGRASLTQYWQLGFGPWTGGLLRIALNVRRRERWRCASDRNQQLGREWLAVHDGPLAATAGWL